MEAKKLIAVWSDRLTNISWFMRTLNEHLARRANEEDRCAGRFWEGRYKSQALLDEAAVLTCMSYVDLNPIRVGITETPETSEFTRIQQRVQQWQHSHSVSKKDTTGSAPKKTSHNKENSPNINPRVHLMPLVKQSQDPHRNAIGYTARDYLELVDWAGRAIRGDKIGAMPNNISPILERLKINPDAYFSYVGRQSFGRSTKIRHQFNKALGSVEKIKAVAKQLEQKFVCGIGDAKQLYTENGS